MRRLEDNPMDPEIAASLDAIDATLAGEPVDPEYAELAELALLLTAERPEMDQAFARSLDERVERGFVARTPRPNRWRWWMAPAGGLAAAGVAAIAVVVGLSGSPQKSPETLAEPSISATHAPASAAARGGAAATAAQGLKRAPAKQDLGALANTPALRPGTPSPATVEPPQNGRKIIQSAQLDLLTPANRIDTVAQEVYNVVGRENGFVVRSEITQGGPNGYAQFTLSVPSSALGATMAQLSQLRYASVSSRTDNIQDVNDQYQADVRRLNDARALRGSLLKQLANATTDAQIASLKAQIADAEAAISSDEATLRALNGQINNSQISLTIAPGSVPTPVHHHHQSAGFTLGKAAHIAGRVLVVAAGVALIVLAGLAPVALLAALAWWIGAAARRRRREQALDLA